MCTIGQEVFVSYQKRMSKMNDCKKLKIRYLIAERKICNRRLMKSLSLMRDASKDFVEAYDANAEVEQELKDLNIGLSE